MVLKEQDKLNQCGFTLAMTIKIEKIAKLEFVSGHEIGYYVTLDSGAKNQYRGIDYDPPTD
jgi:hypothetical protein